MTEKQKEYVKRYNEKHREQMKEYHRQYYLKHREVMLSRAKEYYETHKDDPEYQEKQSISYQKRALKKLREEIRSKHREFARQILDEVWEAFQSTVYDAEFEELFIKIENKYTKENGQ